MIVEPNSYDLPYLDFTVELGDLLENILELEFITESEYDDLVTELWEIYSKQKIEYYKQTSNPFVDL